MFTNLMLRRAPIPQRTPLRAIGSAVLVVVVALVLACAGGSGDNDGGSQNAATDTLTGMYRYMADAGLFADCNTGIHYPVAAEADNAALERAYLDAQTEPGKPMLVVVEGTLAERERMEGAGTDTYLVVERFREVRPGESCPGVEDSLGLADTRWHLVVLGEDTLDVTPEQQPFVELSSAGETVGGYSGCNRFAGRWSSDGAMLSIGHIAGTRMHCEDTADLESGFFDALNLVEYCRVDGDTLSLLGPEGAALARLTRARGKH